MSFVVKSSRAGQNVLTCGLENLNFTSSENLFKLYDYGSWGLELTGSYEINTLEIPHYLGYKPGFSVIGEQASILGGTPGRYVKYTHHWQCGANVDDTYLEIMAIAENPETIHGYYAIFLDPLEE